MVAVRCEFFLKKNLIKIPKNDFQISYEKKKKKNFEEHENTVHA
jgi:hypothetical protein